MSQKSVEHLTAIGFMTQRQMLLLTCTQESSFTHGDLTNGTEYCYYITALYDEGESEVSQTVCATPSFFEPAPPTNVYAEVWDEEISSIGQSQV